MAVTLPEFGQRTVGQVYRPRPAAYAVVTDAHRQVAIVLTAKGYFLPGGGIESGETAEEALVREVREEMRPEHSYSRQDWRGNRVRFRAG